jgi:TatD DNase family protein
MFLHLRAAASDFIEVLRDHHADMTAGVVHSFDGTLEELQSLLTFDNVYIGSLDVFQHPHCHGLA